MRKCVHVIFLLIMTGFLNVTYAYCIADTIKDKTEDGSIIILDSGSSWRINFNDAGVSSDWELGDDVSVCNDSYIIDHDDDDERVGVTKIG